MDKSNFSVEDFVLDSDFREWILSPNKQTNLRWELYLQKYPNRINDIQLAREIVLHLPETDFSLNENEIYSLWNQIEVKLDSQVVEASEAISIPIGSQATIRRHIESTPKAKFNFPLLKIAAMFLLAALLGILYYSLPGREESKEVDWLTYSTKPGVKSSLTLSDGSKVTLNAGTSIRYARDFIGDTREVFLEGEAYFEVAHNPHKPFVVITEDIVTKALGTTFNIRAHPSEKIVISLVTGKVEVKSTEVLDFTDQLTPGEQVSTFAHGNSWEKESFDEEKLLAWIYKTIIFDQTPLPEAIKVLENWFGVKITLNNYADQNLTLSGKFKDETLHNILEGLSYTARFSYEINGKNIQINFKQ
ncbi:ferric-dicitrate binding protein FerR (iron transport regulator) [Algoriphagus sp. 4150]|uniref:FecR family protein n=1 Tax=Algoriphagus sp. 4150 TaxID=2817756 RepID=UPI00286574FA|nr:FecR domain-containing protein [Algoriphagus sp. 4150]MDR7132378.1 ferric-dicitrate binding protein FerR (iron transport regulator) [Algoriphagus sp. 4150]